jgi:hypothetical protein
VVLVVGDRVLVKDQTTGSQNGIYLVASGAWTRATDADIATEFTSGMFTFVSEGTVNASNGYTLNTPAPITVGTTSLVFGQFSGAGQINAGAALKKTGNTLDVAVDGVGVEIITDALRLKDGGVTDTKIGNRTITDATAAAAGADNLTNLLSKLANRIKAITGAANWYDAPAITLATLNARNISTSSGLQGGGNLSGDRTLSIADGGVTDTHIGNRTITDTVAAATPANTITNLLSMLGYMIKQITGKSGWVITPRTTLENAVKLNGDTMTGSLTAPGIDSSAGYKANGGDIIKSNVIAVAEVFNGPLCLAYGAKLDGMFILNWTSANREHRVTLAVNANAFDLNYQLAKISDYMYSGNAVLTNFRVTGSADGATRYLMVDVGNHAGSGTVNLTVEWFGINSPNMSTVTAGTTALNAYGALWGDNTTANRSYVQAASNTNQPISVNTLTKLTCMVSESVDHLNEWDGNTFTAKSAGVYAITLSTELSGPVASGNVTYATAYIVGAHYDMGSCHVTNASVTPMTSATRCAKLNAGDTVSFYFNTSIAANMSPNAQTACSITRIA